MEVTLCTALRVTMQTSRPDGRALIALKASKQTRARASARCITAFRSSHCKSVAVSRRSMRCVSCAAPPSVHLE
jgi:hypothetical protein